MISESEPPDRRRGGFIYKLVVYPIGTVHSYFSGYLDSIRRRKIVREESERLERLAEAVRVKSVYDET